MNTGLYKIVCTVKSLYVSISMSVKIATALLDFIHCSSPVVDNFHEYIDFYSVNFQSWHLGVNEYDACLEEGQ